MIWLYALAAYFIVGLVVAQAAIGNYYEWEDIKGRGLLAALWPIVVALKIAGKL